jgi:hypothetical protein
MSTTGKNSTQWLPEPRSQAVALAFEDLQWADPTSLDLLQMLAGRGAEAPLLLIATARPEFRPPWGLGPHHSVISLALTSLPGFASFSNPDPIEPE